MIEQICAFIHNYFVYEKHRGIFTISGGSLQVSGLVIGQYFRICGSRLNDGVYQYGYTDLKDETFDGEIWDMRPPRTFIQLAEDIENWVAKYGDASMSPYQSESFGGYSYSLKGSSASRTTGDGSFDGWQSIFKAQLNQYRKLA